MTTFDRREEAFEAMFAHDEDMRFRAEAHRAKDLARWVSTLRNQSGAEADQYSADLVSFVVTHPGDAALLERLKDDLGDRTDEATLHKQLASTLVEAMHAVRTA